jgi:Plasmid pRiA4b ORF-3-like protein
MAEIDRHELQIYQLRVVFRGISPLIWRRLLVRSDSTVAQLHEVLQIAFGWDDEHLHRFEIRGREYAVYRDGGGMIGIDATTVRLCDLNLRRLERFVYEYDFGDSGERHRCGERISTGFVESTINQLVAKRFVKKQQMRWTPRGAHLLLQIRVQALNDDLQTSFNRWYPKLGRPCEEKLAA